MSERNWEQLTELSITMLQEEFHEWYMDTRRNLPWRADLNPYRIWVSEIMLQQTRVETVIDYFYRFMEAMPTIKDLAEAPEEQLLKLWEGLGYYSRVRNLQKAAIQIMENFGGVMPQTLAEISSLAGIGPYTAGAILSIAFQQVTPAIDGNVQRVVSRLFLIADDIARPANRKVFEEAMMTIIDRDFPGDFNQALMDLGSSICTPKVAKCDECPLRAYCLAAREGRQLEFPVKSKKAKPVDHYFTCALRQNEAGQLLLKKRPATGLLANMWLADMQEVSKEKYQGQAASADLVAEQLFGFDEYVGEVTHVYSHLKWHVKIAVAPTRQQQVATDEAWIGVADFPHYSFPKVQLKIFELLQKNGYLEND